MTRIAVVLSGCGHLDGAEIRESVLSLLYLDQAGADVTVFAPSGSLKEVNHLTGQETGNSRDILQEAARIARGKISPLSEARAENFDGLVIPGGYGVAKNLSDLAFKGADASVNPEFKSLIESFLTQKKPIGAICIAPAVLVAAVGKSHHPRVTIGEDSGTAGAIQAMGGSHENCPTSGIVIDEQNRIISTSAYMRDDALSNVAKGIEALVNMVLELAKSQRKAA